MGSRAGEHFVTLSERFVIVRKYFVSVTAVQKSHVGQPKDPNLVGTIRELLQGGLSGTSGTLRAGGLSGYECTHTILPFIPKCSPICRAVTL